MSFIPVSKPCLDLADTASILEAVESGWISSLGAFIDEFERKFADLVGVKYAVTVSNGTTGLHLALKALGIGMGDEVIIPDLTFVATANAVIHANAKPIMVDVCRESYCIDPQSIISALTPRTRAIIPVHLYGHPANMNVIMKIAEENNLLVIEDAAEAHGALLGETKVGAFGHCGVFSLYANKIITTGEGGVITTNSEELYKKLRHLRDHAMSKSKRYWHDEVGFNYRMTNIQAALGVSQINKISYFLDERAKILNKYKLALASSRVECNPHLIGATPVNWMVCVVVNGLKRTQRDLILSLMKEKDIDARPFFYPISMLPMYENVSNPISSELSESGLNLPTYVGISDEEIIRSAQIFLWALNESCGVVQ
jgi:perosamine synthetase